MPTGLKVLFEDILSRMPEERPYVEPETSAELRKRLKKNLLDSDRGNQPGIIRETLSEEEASSGRYMRLFVWSNYEATLVHQALHQIVIPKIADCCKRVGICMVWVDFRWAASSSLTEESDTPFLSRKKFVEIQEMVESEMERCFCMSPLLKILRKQSLSCHCVFRTSSFRGGSRQAEHWLLSSSKRRIQNTTKHQIRWN
jgi:hypothetical protein